MGPLPAATRGPALLRGLASPWLTIVFFLLTALSSLAVAHKWQTATALMWAPFLLLGLNLGAAILVTPRFRADIPLLVFHLALLALVMLFVGGRSSYFEGQAVLSRGAVFSGELESVSSGPLHGERFRELRFINLGFVEHHGGVYTNRTVNRMSWQDPSTALWHEAEISDDHPLLLNGYRIYPSTIRGFAPLFEWQPLSGPVEHGSLQLPPVGSMDFPKGISWTLANGMQFWATIWAKESPLLSGSRANLGAHELDHVIVLRSGDRRHELRPNESLQLAEGRLTYLELDVWHGYHITADPTRPWVVACVALAIASLVWFYVRRLWRPLPAGALE